MKNKKFIYFFISTQVIIFYKIEAQTLNLIFFSISLVVVVINLNKTTIYILLYAIRIGLIPHIII